VKINTFSFWFVPLAKIREFKVMLDSFIWHLDFNKRLSSNFKCAW
jgi:hypothetical protein